MTKLLAIAELRLREGVAARLAWLVVLAFAVGLGAALWVHGPDAAARAALADRIVLWTTWGLAFVVAAVVPALGLPADVRTGAAQTLFASPASRLQVLLGGTLGYGALATLLLTAMAGASVLGMQAAGLGAAQRDPVRAVTVAELVDAKDGVLVVSREAPVAAFRFRVSAGVHEGEPLRVRFAPRRLFESNWEAASSAFLSVHRPGEAEASGRQVTYKAGVPFTALLPIGELRAGDEAEVTFRRAVGGWKLVFAPGSVEVGGGSELYSLSLLAAALCAAPLLFVLAAIGSLGASRFGAPTAVMFASFLFLVFVGQDFLADAARFVVKAAENPSLMGIHDHDHAGGEAGHDHNSAAQITPLRLALAKGALAVFSAMPRYGVFDRTDDLVERRGLSAGDVGRAALAGLPALAVLTAAGWLLLRRREIVPG